MAYYARVHDSSGYARRLTTLVPDGGTLATTAVATLSSLTSIATITTGVWAATDVGVAHGGTGASTAAAAATNLGLGTGDSPQLTAVNIGHANDTTLSRPSAGDLQIEANIIYRAGGTDVAIADGGTGAGTLSAAGIVTTSGGADMATALNRDMDGDFTIGNQSGDVCTIGGALTVTGNLIVSGTTTTVNTATLSVEDPLIILASGNDADSVDVGFYAKYVDSGTKYAGLFRDASDSDKWKLFATTGNTNEAPTTTVNTGSGFTYGTLVVDTLVGAVTGNASTATLAATATALATARTIGGTSFDGTGNIAVGLAATATALASARTIGGTSFDGTANIVPGTITVADTTDTTAFVGLWEAATGDLAPKSDAGLTYNAGTGTLTATAFAGPITGNVTGNASGTALTVTQAAQTAITSLGTLTALQVDYINADASTLTITDSSDTGDKFSIATTTHGATTIATLDDDAAAAHLTLDVDGNITLDADAGTITFADNGSSLGTITSAGWTGAVVGDVTGNADTATLATSVTVSANNSTNETVYPLFVDAATGTQGAETDTGLSYNPSSGLLTATGITGNLFGALTGTLNGVVGGGTPAAGTFTNLVGSTNLTLASGATVTIIDNAGLATGSATRLATQGAIKTYVDAQITAGDLDFTGSAGTGAVDLDSQALSIVGSDSDITTAAGNQALTITLNSVSSKQLSGCGLTGVTTLTNTSVLRRGVTAGSIPSFVETWDRAVDTNNGTCAATEVVRVHGTAGASNFQITKADADTAADATAEMAILVDATGGSERFAQYGEIVLVKLSDPAAALSIGAPLFLSATAGHVTDAEPSTGAWRRILGYCAKGMADPGNDAGTVYMRFWPQVQGELI